MSALEILDAETGELVPAPHHAANLFGTDDPRELVLAAKARADELAAVIKERGLFKIIGGKAHVEVEAWTLLGSMLGVFAVAEGEPEWVEIEGVGGFRATVAAVTRDGAVVGRASAFCMRDENTWKSRNIYALAAMAETRATSRALRKPLGFIMKLAGYNPTGAEEMPDAAGQSSQPKVNPSNNRKVTKKDHARLHAVIDKLKKEHPDKDWEAISKHLALEMFRAESRADLTVSEMDELIKALPTADVPF